MKKLYKLILAASLLWVGTQSVYAQKFMGVGTEKPNPRAVLELNVEDPTNYQQGFLPPKLTTAQRIAFGTVLASTTLTGMTVYDTGLSALFVWTGAWSQLASSAAVNISATGINGSLVTASGLGFTIDGSNFVQKIQSLITGDVKGSFQSGFTVTGLNSAPINFSLINPGDVLQFDGTSIVGFNPSTFQNTTITGANGILVNQNGQGFTVDGSNLLTSIAGASGISINQVGTAFTVTGAPQTLTSVAGINGAQVTQNGQGFTVDGSNLVQTITGGAGVTISTITGGFTVNVTAAQLTSIAGINGALVTQNGQGFTVDGSNLLTSIAGASGISINQVGTAFTVTGVPQTLASITGINGAQVAQNGQGFTVDGSNLVQNTQNATLGDVKGNYSQGFTVTGLNSAPINTALIVPGNVLQFDGTSIVGFNVASLQNTSIVGQNGVNVNQNGQGFTVDGSNLVQTITGGAGVTISTITGGFNVNVATNSITGVSGISVVNSGASVSVSGAGLVLASQSLANPVGTSVASFGTTPLSRTIIQIPTGVKNVRIVINGYKLQNLGTADIRINIGAAAPSTINIPSGGTSDDPDNFVTSANIDVSAFNGSQVLKIFGQADATATGVMLAGYTLYIID